MDNYRTYPANTRVMDLTNLDGLVFTNRHNKIIKSYTLRCNSNIDGCISVYNTELGTLISDQQSISAALKFLREGSWNIISRELKINELWT